MLPWLVWLSGLSAGLQTEGLPVWFQVRAHAWVAGQVPSEGRARGSHPLLFLSLSLSFPLCLKKKKKRSIYCGAVCNNSQSEIYLFAWLLWLSGLSAGLWTKGAQVQFPARAHAWVAGQVSSWGRARGNQSMFLSNINVSPAPFLPSKNK